MLKPPKLIIAITISAAFQLSCLSACSSGAPPSPFRENLEAYVAQLRLLQNVDMNNLEYDGDINERAAKERERKIEIYLAHEDEWAVVLSGFQDADRSSIPEEWLDDLLFVGALSHSMVEFLRNDNTNSQNAHSALTNAIEFRKGLSLQDWTINKLREFHTLEFGLSPAVPSNEELRQILFLYRAIVRYDKFADRAGSLGDYKEAYKHNQNTTVGRQAKSRIDGFERGRL